MRLQFWTQIYNKENSKMYVKSTTGNIGFGDFTSFDLRIKNIGLWDFTTFGLGTKKNKEGIGNARDPF